MIPAVLDVVGMLLVIAAAGAALGAPAAMLAAGAFALFVSWSLTRSPK